MQTISATEAKQNLAALLDAVQREPVMIRRHERNVAVVLSPGEYERLRQFKVAEFRQFADRISDRAAERGMTDEKLTALLKGE